MPPTFLNQGEREAIGRVFEELHRAASADVTDRLPELLGYISGAAKLAAHDVQHQAGAERLHAQADWLVEAVAELTERR